MMVHLVVHLLDYICTYKMAAFFTIVSASTFPFMSQCDGQQSMCKLMSKFNIYEMIIQICAKRSERALLFPKSILCSELNESVSMTTWSGLSSLIHSYA